MFPRLGRGRENTEAQKRGKRRANALSRNVWSADLPGSRHVVMRKSCGIPSAEGVGIRGFWVYDLRVASSTGEVDMVDLTAREIMVSDVISVNEGARLTEVADTLITYGISGMPVVNDQGRLVGMISEADLMNQKKRQSAIPRLALFGVFKVPDRLLKEAYQEGCAMHAKDLMSHKVITAEPDTPAEELADIMVRRRINRIPIVEDGKLVGIVTRTDILRGQCGLSCGACPVPEHQESHEGT